MLRHASWQQCSAGPKGLAFGSWASWRRHRSASAAARGPARAAVRVRATAGGGGGGSGGGAGGGSEGFDIDALAARLAAEAEKMRQSGMSLDPEDEAEEAAAAAAAGGSGMSPPPAAAARDSLLQPLGYEVRPRQLFGHPREEGMPCMHQRTRACTLHCSKG